MGFLKTNKPLTIKEHSLWRFSIDFYADKTNREALLFLQKQHQLNINIILAMLWHAVSGRGTCKLESIKNLLTVIKPWQINITEGIRDIRCKIDKQHQELYQLALDAELYSEKIQQSIIYDFFIDTYSSSVSSKKKAKEGIHNLQTYLTLTKVNLSDLGYQHTRHLLSQAFVAFKEYDFPQMSLEL